MIKEYVCEDLPLVDLRKLLRFTLEGRDSNQDIFAQVTRGDVVSH